MEGCWRWLEEVDMLGRGGEFGRAGLWHRCLAPGQCCVVSLVVMLFLVQPQQQRPCCSVLPPCWQQQQQAAMWCGPAAVCRSVVQSDRTPCQILCQAVAGAAWCVACGSVHVCRVGLTCTCVAIGSQSHRRCESCCGQGMHAVRVACHMDMGAIFVVWLSRQA